MQNVDIVALIQSGIVNKKLIKNSHQKLMPAVRRHQMANFEHKMPARLSAVLILLYEKEEILHFVLTRRPDYEGVHGGQISLPGGKKEESDVNLQETALRETEEEIGVPRKNIRVLGELSELFIPPSNFHLTPFVGFHAGLPLFIADSNEVASIEEIPLTFLLQDDNIFLKHFKASSQSSIEAPYFLLKDAEVWGATAMILSEFRDICLSVLPLDFYKKKKP